mmetsp:Transcript_8467/g.27858  ORF Transcript_8467/g.27858 Transcript_8467/m.27858 type:complete len:252 (+) Transcript_8467:690-1445(+)
MLPEAQVDQRERCALFPGRSCLPLSPVEDDSTPEPNLDQLNVIFSVIGTPRASLDWIELPEMRDYLRSLLPVPATPLHDVYPAAPGSAIELLESMLSFEPFERLTVEEALHHKFFDTMTYHISSDLAAKPVDAATIDFEHEEVTTSAIRKLVVAEIAIYTAMAEAEATPASPAGAQGEAPATSGADESRADKDIDGSSADAGGAAEVREAGADGGGGEESWGSGAARDDASRPAKKRKRPFETSAEAPAQH